MATVRITDTVRMDDRQAGVRVYYLVWRTRPTHAWRSEEFDSRTRAYQRYFALVDLGIEVYLERRWAMLPA